MDTKSFNNTRLFTTIALIVATAVSLCGVFLNDLYRDNLFIKAVWRGNDVITLVIAVPLMLFALIVTRKNPLSKPTLLFIWMGCLWYMIYNYIFYIYGAAFNVFFLGYVVIIIASVLGLLHGLIAMKQAMDQLIPPRILTKSFRGISLFLLLFGLLLGGMWVGLASTFLVTGVVPTAITQTDHPTGVVFATDLLFLVAPLITLSYYLAKKNRWAMLITPMVLVKCCLYPFVFIVSGIFAYLETNTYDPLTPIYLLLGVGAAIALFRLLGRYGHAHSSH